MRLTTTPPQFALSRLSRQLYTEFLDRARPYDFVRFQQFLPGAPAPPERFILLRHDVDFAPAYSLEMAELEHAAGVAATYFVLVDGQFYNPLARDVVGQLRRIHALGHEVGLHFAAAGLTGSDLGQEVAFRMRVLEDILGTDVRSFSQHDPVNDGEAMVTLPAGHRACVDAREVIRRHDLLYVSDSGMMWRRHTFATAMDEDRSLCLLAHPHSWLHPEDDYIAMIRDFESREVRSVAGRFDAFVDNLSGYYTRRLEEGI